MIDTPADGAAQSPSTEKRTAAEWLEDIKKAEIKFSTWGQRARKIEKIYLDEREDATKTTGKYALLWANISVLQPAVYAQPPKPAVARRYTDGRNKDAVARSVSEVMERSLTTLFDLGDIDSCLKGVRDNFLVVARGTAWVRYVPTFGVEEVEGPDGQIESIETLTDEALAFDFVHWSDFIHPEARRWEDLPWVARRVYLDKTQLTKRFGAEKSALIMAATESKRPGTGDTVQLKDMACVYEIWSKRDNEVLWIAKDYGEDAADRKPPLYDLRGFFPCPKPAYGTVPTDKLEPVPDYVYYQDQADEINTLTARIGALQDALKLVGFYPASEDGDISTAIETALSPDTGNKMIPVASWAAFAQGGGSRSMIEWLPVENVVLVLKSCIETRGLLIEDVFQITGISDIIRGSTDPRETRGAQQIKAQWGSIRIRDRQAELARFSRDMTRISAEIIAEKFQPETLWRLAGMEFPTMEQKQAIEAEIQRVQRNFQMMAQQAQAQGQQPPQMPPMPDQIKDILGKPSQEVLVGLMRDDRMRSYRIDIETDSTIAPDEDAEKASRQEFVTVLGGLLQQAVPVASQVPELVPVIGESLLFLTRAYRTGRSLEETVEQAVEAIMEKAASSQNAPQQPPPDPRMEKIKQDGEIADKKLQQEAQEAAADLQLDQAKFEHEKKLDWAELASETRMKQMRIAAENANAFRRGM